MNISVILLNTLENRQKFKYNVKKDSTPNFPIEISIFLNIINYKLLN